MGLKVYDFISTFEEEYGIRNYTIKLQRGHKVVNICTPSVIDKEYPFASLLVAYYYFDPDKKMLVVFL